MKSTNKQGAHGKTQLKYFDSHRGLCQSEENKYM